MTGTQAHRYLSLLGVGAHAPTRAGLSALVAAHLARVPFENLSKLIQHGRRQPAHLPTLDGFLDGIEHLRLGGTCYACAIHFHALLRHLGYDVRLCGAAMGRPDVHAVNVVCLDGRAWLVDVGYGAPLGEALPLDTCRTIPLGEDRYVLHPADASGKARLEHWRGEECIHGYTLDTTPRAPAHFTEVIADSFRPGAEFLIRLRIMSHRPERSILVRDRDITVIEGQAIRRRTLGDASELAGVLEALLKIPARTTAEALAALPSA